MLALLVVLLLAGGFVAWRWFSADHAPSNRLQSALQAALDTMDYHTANPPYEQAQVGPIVEAGLVPLDATMKDSAFVARRADLQRLREVVAAQMRNEISFAVALQRVNGRIVDGLGPVSSVRELTDMRARIREVRERSPAYLAQQEVASAPFDALLADLDGDAAVLVRRVSGAKQPLHLQHLQGVVADIGAQMAALDALLLHLDAHRSDWHLDANGVGVIFSDQAAGETFERLAGRFDAASKRLEASTAALKASAAAERPSPSDAR